MSNLPDPTYRYYLKSKKRTVFGWDNQRKEDAPKEGDSIVIVGKMHEVQAVETYNKLINADITGFSVAVKGRHL